MVRRMEDRKESGACPSFSYIFQNMKDNVDVWNILVYTWLK